MCGFFTHGFWWQEKEDFAVVADWEINSHRGIREYRKDLIPANAKRWGFNPVNGEPLTNEDEPLPEKVKEKICLLREMYFPNKEAIAEWMRKNYGKQNDQTEWEIPLLQMLDDGGRELFSQKHYEGWIKYYEGQIEYYEGLIKHYEGWIEYCTGSLDKMDIDKLADYFLQHPNFFWSERIEERKVEYKSFVRV